MMHCQDCARLGRELHHLHEARRIQRELDGLNPDVFSPDGIVRLVLRERIQQEYARARGEL